MIIYKVVVKKEFLNYDGSLNGNIITIEKFFKQKLKADNCKNKEIENLKTINENVVNECFKEINTNNYISKKDIWENNNKPYTLVTNISICNVEVEE